jgi:hypothetical protein
MRTGGTPGNPQTFSSIPSFVFCRQAVAEPNLVRREWPKPSDPSSCQGTWPRGLVFHGTNMIWSNWVDQVWLVVDIPLWKIWVRWVPNIWKNVPNHQSEVKCRWTQKEHDMMTGEGFGDFKSGQWISLAYFVLGFLYENHFGNWATRQIRLANLAAQSVNGRHHN